MKLPRLTDAEYEAMLEKGRERVEGIRRLNSDDIDDRIIGTCLPDDHVRLLAHGTEHEIQEYLDECDRRARVALNQSMGRI